MASPNRHPHDVPEPVFAERARTLVHLGRSASLSTNSRRVEGHPFGSVALYGVDPHGQPTLLLSGMAMHTQNLAADARASLLVTQPQAGDDLMAGARVTLLGRAVPVSDTEREAIREDYLARHPSAHSWASFGDFAFYRLEVADLYFVAGFGAMGWVAAEEYRSATPDPLADHAAGIIEHMNADHSDALVLYCKAFAGLDADEATMTAVDRLGLRVRARAGDAVHSLRINFLREARTPLEARKVLVEMVRQARSTTSTS